AVVTISKEHEWIPDKDYDENLMEKMYPIVTNNRGFYTPLEKIKNYYGIVTVISMCVIFSMTYIVIVLSGKRRRWAFAGFEVLRLIVNASIHNEYRTNVEKLEDLRDSRYDVIYGGLSIPPLINDPLLKKKFIVTHPNCASLIIGNNSAACICDILYLSTVVFDEKFHMSKEPISKTVYSLPIRDDWPLRERVDIFLMRLEQ
ncbi:hypothetical protein PV328_012217, partial [Microctonus aethiopoides]